MGRGLDGVAQVLRLITIRTLTACAGNIYCSAGGGIVADSEVQAEYQETFDKVNRILQQLET